jgi:hypothetical protein
MEGTFRRGSDCIMRGRGCMRWCRGVGGHSWTTWRSKRRDRFDILCSCRLSGNAAKPPQACLSLLHWREPGSVWSLEGTARAAGPGSWEDFWAQSHRLVSRARRSYGCFIDICTAWRGSGAQRWQCRVTTPFKVKSFVLVIFNSAEFCRQRPVLCNRYSCTHFYSALRYRSIRCPRVSIANRISPNFRDPFKRTKMAPIVRPTRKSPVL